MYGLYGLERARSVTGCKLNGWKWAIPVACGLALTTTIALTIEEPLARRLSSERPALSTIVDRTDLSQARGYHLAKFVYADSNGIQSSQDCLTTSAYLAEGEVLKFSDAEEMPRVWSTMCESLQNEAMALSSPPPQP